MDTETLPVLSLAAPAGQFSDDIGDCFRRYGFAMVKDHGINADLIARGWELTAQFFALPDSEKHRYLVEGLAGARGYTPFGVEIAKDAKAHDLKEFWHVGRDVPRGGLLAGVMEPNVWPDRPEGFQETFTRLFTEFDRVGNFMLSRIAVHLGLSADWFEDVVENGNSVLRLLHYPPVAAAEDGAIRAGAHEDINLITLLLGAEEAGLELLTRDGRWLGVSPPAGALAINIGDMLQRLTNHVLPSTTHRVRNPSGERAAYSRYSMPYFLHPRSDFPIVTLPQCVTAQNPDRYRDPITADEYLQQRLREIGLKG
jgi:isopenicillin N synthase-like dioxygenase